MAAAPLRIPPSKPILLSSEPQLFVSDIGASCAFYRDKLGFDIAFAYGEPAFYAQVARDGARLNLRHVDGPVFDAAFRQNEKDALSAMITVDDIHGLHQEFLTNGATFHQNLKREAWGSEVFIVRDPDGNLIGFAG
jgi:catechol 2,3-dioxygenase-like lactoylglutathione lyase family enzyme